MKFINTKIVSLIRAIFTCVLWYTWFTKFVLHQGATIYRVYTVVAVCVWFALGRVEALERGVFAILSEESYV